jgi:hypothetical protein
MIVLRHQLSINRGSFGIGDEEFARHWAKDEFRNRTIPIR